MREGKKLRPVVALFVLATPVLFLSRYVRFIRNVSESMSPTIRDGQKVFAVKSEIRRLRRGDIVLAKTRMELDLPVLKRIVACPGDHVRIENSEIRVNGELVAEDIGINNKEQSLTMKEEEYYLVGDNVRDSFDSRNFGPIREEDVLYVVLFVK